MQKGKAGYGTSHGMGKGKKKHGMTEYMGSKKKHMAGVEGYPMGKGKTKKVKGKKK